jgi:hypothetical protein
VRPLLPAVLAAAALGVGGCGGAAAPRAPQPDAPLPAELAAQVRPIGRGPAYQPPAPDRRVPRCRPRLGPRIAVHLELFAADRVALVPAGVGTRPPRHVTAGRIERAACYGDVVTLDPTGVAFLRPGRRYVLADLFRAWGKPLTARRMAAFRGRVHVFVDGRRRRGDPRTVALAAHRQIVLEVGPHVPPHPAYRFPAARR